MRGVIRAGFLGSVVLVVWLVVVNGLLGFGRDLMMKELEDERAVHAFLVEHVPEPGRYVCNPEILPGQGFPGEDPVFSVQYSGLGHAAAWQEAVLGLLVVLAAPMLGAWLLGHASTSVLSRYNSRVLFFWVIGVVFSLFGTMGRFGLAGHALGPAVALSILDLTGWLLAGLVVARIVRPEESAARGTA